jgi:hypothetical protein
MTSVSLLATASAGVTAGLGTLVAWLAYRGYRRNDSPVMRALAVGVVAIAVVPFAVDVVGMAVSLTDAQALLAVTLSHALGLFAIYRTFDSGT